MTEEVTQADREAAADLWSAVFPYRQGEADCMRRGIGDDGPVVAALAKHRLAHLPTDLSEERAKEVLLSVADDCGWSEINLESECWQTSLHAMQQYAAGLQGEVERLREALEFYADPDRWDDFEQDAMASVYDRNGGSELGRDKGMRAYNAIRNLKSQDEPR